MSEVQVYEINLKLQKAHFQALHIATQLLEGGEFKLSGKDLEVASKAKAIAMGLFQEMRQQSGIDEEAAPESAEAPAEEPAAKK